MNKRELFLTLLALSTGIAIGYAICGIVQKQKETGSAYVIRREGQYKHVNPLLECDIADDILRNQELKPFRDKVEVYLKSQIAKGRIISASIYFRELNDGIWFSIGNMDQFVPASLRKVPMLIAILKMSERGQQKNLLDMLVVNDLTDDHTAFQNIKPSQSLAKGQSYTVRELLRRMIKYSDNNAFKLLASKVVTPFELENVYATLRMKNPRVPQDDEFLSVQTYASFFRVLYNATYLSKETSDWALQLLSESEFTAGLVAGVPQSIEVSHKFGEYSDERAGTIQLHDCGIVYYPRHPYLLCVMTRGREFQPLDDIIVDVSKTVYSEVNSQFQKHATTESQ